MGIGKFLKKAAKVALPIAGAYFGGPIGAAVGSGISSKVNHEGWGQGLLNAGISAATAGLTGTQGSLTPANSAIGSFNKSIVGAFDPVRSGLSSLSSGAEKLFSGTSLGESPSLPWLTQASGSTMAAAPGSAQAFANLSPSAGGGATGGGSISGFFSPGGLARGAMKYGLTSALSKDNETGYNLYQQAANDAADTIAPYSESATAAQRQLADLYGLNGEDAVRSAMSKFQYSPSYDFVRNEGIRALDASAARRGMLRSGTQDRAVQEYGTELARQELQQYLRNLQNEAGKGLTAANAQNSYGIDAATAAAMLKQAKADRYNQMIGGISNFFA